MKRNKNLISYKVATIPPKLFAYSPSVYFAKYIEPKREHLATRISHSQDQPPIKQRLIILCRQTACKSKGET